MDQMSWVRDNFLDLVDYANGPSDSEWGSERAEAGHPASFNLKYVEIGNENANREYEERYRFIYESMKRVYPDLIYLADISYYRMPQELYDIADQHYYNSPNWFLARHGQYDDRDRSLPPLYLGEVAVTSDQGGPLRGNLLAALAEGVYLMGCERNADVVTMVSYAPLLAHVSGRSWNWHGMIYHDSTRVFGTVSYYLWKLFAENRPDRTLKTEIEFPNAKPAAIAGQIGIGTWDATAEFKDIRIEQDGKVLYTSDFAGGATDWATEGGGWQVDGGVYRQNRRGYGLSYFGDPKWSDYSLTLKARKLSGREGFLVVFGRQGAEKYWWNLGGWSNQQHEIELNQNIVGQPVRGRIESERWYDIKIELAGNRIRCYLDGELVHDVTSAPPPKLFVTAGVANAGGELVLKAINTSTEPQAVTLRLRGIARTASEASLTVLTSERLSDNNSLDRPRAVVPVESPVGRIATEFAHEFPPYSLTILRLGIAPH
jgi:alpha-L-arabinofuranosidase